MTKTAGWRAFIEAFGLRFEDDGHTVDVRGANERTLHLPAGTRTHLCDLSGSYFVRVKGADAESFLHAQLTHDIRGLDTKRVRLCGYCDPRGRLLAVLYVARIEDGFLLQMPRSIADAVISRLRMFVLRSKVAMEACETLVSCGIHGPDASALLTGVVPALPGASMELEHGASLMVIRRPAALPRYQLIAPVDDLTDLVGRIGDAARFVASSYWSWLDIQAGIPSVFPETSGLFVPQMVNLDLVDGVSFSKGCYPGQEIVARMRYLGKLKQRMFLCHVDAGGRPGPGAEVAAQDAESAIGRVVDAQYSPQGGLDMLAVLRIEQARSCSLSLDDGRPVAVRELPYPLSNDSQRQA